MIFFLFVICFSLSFFPFVFFFSTFFPLLSVHMFYMVVYYLDECYFSETNTCCLLVSITVCVIIVIVVVNCIIVVVWRCILDYSVLRSASSRSHQHPYSNYFRPTLVGCSSVFNLYQHEKTCPMLCLYCLRLKSSCFDPGPLIGFLFRSKFSVHLTSL